MVILCKRNVIIPSDDGKASKFIPKDYIGAVENWVTKTQYFNALVADGKIVITKSPKDSDVDKAVEKPVTDRSRRKKAEETEKAEENVTEETAKE